MTAKGTMWTLRCNNLCEEKSVIIRAAKPNCQTSAARPWPAPLETSIVPAKLHNSLNFLASFRGCVINSVSLVIQFEFGLARVDGRVKRVEFYAFPRRGRASRPGLQTINGLAPQRWLVDRRSEVLGPKLLLLTVQLKSHFRFINIRCAGPC